MSIPPSRERYVIPRWRSYEETALIGELDPRPCRGDRAWRSRRGGLEAREEEWSADRPLSFAADLVGATVVLGAGEKSAEAARRLLDAGAGMPLLQAAARRAMDMVDGEGEREGIVPAPTPAGERIQELRRSTRRNGRNAIRWSELARFHTIAGHKRKAERCMRVAVTLAPLDRYVLRCAARLQIHLGRPDRAAALLGDVAARGDDPWLVAAGLATAAAADAPSKLAKVGYRMLSSGSFSAFQVSELASALGTLEVGHGNDRVARRLFRTALEKPTDNSIAQAEWASRLVAGIALPEWVRKQPESWEARAWLAAEVGDRHLAMSEAWRWHYDQPFASRPAEFGSYHASVVGQYEAGAEIARAALPSNRDKFMLLNNLAFCLASADRPNEAIRHLAAIRTSELASPERATYWATRGLIAFRLDCPREGHHFYERAERIWRDPAAQAMTLILLAREKKRLGEPDAAEFEARARSAGEALDRPDVRAWLKQLDRDG